MNLEVYKRCLSWAVELVQPTGVGPDSPDSQGIYYLRPFLRAAVSLSLCFVYFERGDERN